MKKIWSLLLAQALILSGCQQAPAAEVSYAGQPPSSVSVSTPTSDELLKLGRQYLEPVFYAGIARSAWESPEQLDAGDLITFYLYAISYGVSGFTYPETYTVDENLDYYLPADIVENTIMKYFDVTPEYMRTDEHYDEKTNAYITYGLSRLGIYNITSVSSLDGIVVIDFDIYENGVQHQIGSLHLKQRGDAYQYISCDIQKGDNITPYDYDANKTKLLGIDDASIKDLNDLEIVSQVYIRPIDAIPYLWLDSWESPSEISATTLVNICAMSNFLHLPVNFEGSYLEPEVSAEQVESSIKKHFEVTSEQLKTAESYNPENNRYSLGCGIGPNGTRALSAKQNGNKIEIRVGVQDFWEPDEIRYMKIIPAGTLTVRLNEENVIQYLSFQKEDAFDGHALFFR